MDKVNVGGALGNAIIVKDGPRDLPGETFPSAILTRDHLGDVDIIPLKSARSPNRRAYWADEDARVDGIAQAELGLPLDMPDGLAYADRETH